MRQDTTGQDRTGHGRGRTRQDSTTDDTKAKIKQGLAGDYTEIKSFDLKTMKLMLNVNYVLNLKSKKSSN